MSRGEVINNVLTAILDDIPDKKFRDELVQLNQESRDVVFNGDVQVGKTKIMINLIWMTKFKTEFNILVFAWERRDVLDQLKVRASEFDRKLSKEYPNQYLTMNPFEIRSDTPLEACITAYTQGTRVFFTILSAKRLGIVDELLNGEIEDLKGSKWRVIIDEGDMSIKQRDAKSEESLSKLLSNENLHFFYFGATNFAIFNSPSRMERNPRVVRLPQKLYKNFTYRSYYDYEHHVVEELDDPNIVEEELRTLIKILRKMEKKASETQPNIGLLNIVRENKFKFNMAPTISSAFPSFYIIVYTGEGYSKYKGGDLIIKEQEGICVGRVISDIQNNTPDIGGILFIATNMAGRAQTFKSSDNTWVLTHMFLILSKTSSVETIVQSLRGNGQYLDTQPVLKFYAPKSTHRRIKIALENNEKIMKELSKGEDIKTTLLSIPFTVEDKPIPFSNRSLKGYRLKGKTRGYDMEFGSVEEFENVLEKLLEENQCQKYLMINEYRRIKIKVLHNLVGELEIENEKLSMTPAQKKVIREWLAEKYGVEATKVRIASNKTLYSKYSSLNEVVKRGTRIIALDYMNKDTFPVVIYNDEEFLENGKDAYPDYLIVWYTTQGTVRVLINTTRAKYLYKYLQ